MGRSSGKSYRLASTTKPRHDTHVTGSAVVIGGEGGVGNDEGENVRGAGAGGRCVEYCTS